MPPGALAEGIFGLPEGVSPTPIQSPLGWHIVRINKIEAGTSVSFDEIKGKLEQELKAHQAPDLAVHCAAGYRVSWESSLGGAPLGLFADNVKKWGGDHIIDPTLVPGVLFMNRPFRTEGARLLDLAPTILAALGVAKGPAMEGESLLP